VILGVGAPLGAVSKTEAAKIWLSTGLALSFETISACLPLLGLRSDKRISLPCCFHGQDTGSSFEDLRPDLGYFISPVIDFSITSFSHGNQLRIFASYRLLQIMGDRE
jgi:hypothetical protein